MQSVRTGILVVLFALLSLVGGSLYLVLEGFENEARVGEAHAERYESYRRLDELRQSSDDLTRMARTYVVTGDARYRAAFDRTLAIRDGTAPRPQSHDRIRWDLLSSTSADVSPDAEAVSLEQLMRQSGVGEEEFVLLRRAEQRSSRLVELEERAMNAVEGRYPDEQGRYVVRGEPDLELARSLLHGREYEEAKASIMEPLDAARRSLDARTEAEVEAIRTRGERLGNLAAFVLAMEGLVLLLSLLWLHQKSKRAPDSQEPSHAVSFGIRGILDGWPLMLGAAVACLAVLTTSWWLNGWIRERVRANITSEIRTVLDTTQSATDDWFESVRAEAHLLSELPAIRQGLGVLRSPTSTGGELRTARQQLSALLRPLAVDRQYEDYLLFSPEGQVLAGGRHLTDREDVVSAGFLAELAAPPHHHAVSLPFNPRADAAHRDGSGRSIVIGAAILDEQRTVIGGLALVIDPAREFSEILQRGRLGDSGETYAFNAEGDLISESRFDHHLQSIGLVEEGQRGILNIAIRDPGANLLEGGTPSAERHELPLTRMARSATQGSAGLDIDGYNDYRGVPVIGAWNWSEAFGYGVTTEVDVAEAYAVLRDYQLLNWLMTGIAVALIIGLTLLFIQSRGTVAAANAKLEEAYSTIKIHSERMEGELNIGREIQMSMLPLIFPAFPDHDEFQIFALLEPAREVGGDFYDFFFIDEKHICFCVGDVSGKGVPSALFMAVSKTLIKSNAAADLSTGSILTQVNEELSSENDACMFVTVFLGILDIFTGELTYTSAGHNPPLIRRNDAGLEWVRDRHGPVVGAMEGVAFGESRLTLEPGELFLLYTDGITEAMNAEHQLYGEERLLAEVGSRPDRDAKDLLKDLIEDVKVYEGGPDQRTDDVTIMAVKFKGTPSGWRRSQEQTIIKNRTEEIQAAIAALDAFVETNEIPTAVATKFNVALDEVLANVVSYAFPEEEESLISIRFESDPRRFIVTVEDKGIAFNPLKLATPDTTLGVEEREIGGLGIHLTRNLIEEVTYRRLAGRNVLTLIHPLAPAGGESQVTDPSPT